ncbi:MAG: hypothetical protein DRJ10_01260 [Bacteroidetes bacterium]|nr:MAG: hypothetical protein DRJ10_01260 [Bacteroidota bacterium]
MNTKTENKPDYKKFLIENGAYQQFCDNLRNLNNESFEVFWNDLVRNKVTDYGGSTAFGWAESIEGFEFWNELDLLWCKKIGRW